VLEISKAADLDYLVQGGQLYTAFPFSKGSVVFTFVHSSWCSDFCNPCS